MTRRFGSSGIRGPVGEAITVDLALDLGRAIGKDHKRVAVGRDARTSSPMLAEAAIAGLLAEGAEVYDAGLLPTPALAYAARNFDCGLVVTASHNPAPDNGFKLWTPEGMAFDAPRRARIERHLAGSAGAGAPWRDLKARLPLPSAVNDHAAAVERLVGSPARPLRIVLDCGNGAACVESPFLLRALGHEVVTLNAQPDGTFPGRPSEPSEKNLAALRSLVLATGADLGIAHDGDADRAMAVSEDGKFVSGDALLAIFAARAAKRRVVMPVDTSLAVADALEGVEIVHTRVGDAFVSEAIVERGAEWGGEPSGAWIFPEISLCPDGPYAAAYLAALVAREGPLSKLVAALPVYPIAREAVAVPAEAKDAIVARATEILAGAGRATTLDGVRVDTDVGWMLLRASGTEPKIRITAEARRREALEGLLALARDALARATASAERR